MKTSQKKLPKISNLFRKGVPIRITSGTLKGRVLTSPASSETHPMGSREKLALFNMLGNYFVENATVLDAYAGSGALGIEAISRGAKSVVFLEKSPRAASVIRQNLQDLNLDAPVIVGAAEHFTPVKDKSLPRHGSYKVDLSRPALDPTFDLILADPPYDAFNHEAIQHLAKFLTAKGVLALSHPSDTPPKIPGLSLLTTRQYARARITLYRKESA